LEELLHEEREDLIISKSLLNQFAQSEDLSLRMRSDNFAEIVNLDNNQNEMCANNNPNQFSNNQDNEGLFNDDLVVEINYENENDNNVVNTNNNKILDMNLGDGNINLFNELKEQSKFKLKNAKKSNLLFRTESKKEKKDAEKKDKLFVFDINSLVTNKDIFMKSVHHREPKNTFLKRKRKNFAIVSFI